MSDISISNLKHAALLSMDYQNGIVANYGGSPELLDRATGVLDSARRTGMRVIHVHVGFRPGFPEINPRNAMFGAILSSPERRKMFEGGGSDIHDAVAPINDEVVITKHRVSAFSNSDLDMVLCANDIDTLVMYGVATSGVVLSTLVDAADRDYKIYVIKDCCADQDEELHTALIDRYFPKRGTVLTAEEFTSL
jgi:nicotinamidase-related amidase